MTRFKRGDMLSIEEVAEHFGYALDYVRHMIRSNHKSYDPELARIKISTDATWREANGRRCVYVFEYGAVKAWYAAKQARPIVQAHTHQRRRVPAEKL